MDNPQVSGKVFRFLSAMHPSLSKSERKRYAGFDPEQWYPWTAEVAAEFTDLVKRTPRDSSFARGFAYVAQKAVPEGRYVTAAELVANIERLPAAYRGPEGSGFSGELAGESGGTVSYRGMPGFKNVCIPVLGELEQRLKASGAVGLQIKHGPVCRLQGGDECSFEVSWSAETPPERASEISVDELLGPGSGDGGSAVADAASAAGRAPETAAAAVRSARPASSADSSRAAAGARALSAAQTAAKPAAASAAQTQSRPAPAAAAQAAAAPATAATAAPGASNDDLFSALKARLLEAEQQTARHTELEGRIAELESLVEQTRQESARALAAAQALTEQARAELADLKRKIRDLVGND